MEANQGAEPVRGGFRLFAGKLISNPYKITAKDAQSFRDAGLDAAAYVDVYNTVAIR